MSDVLRSEKAAQSERTTQSCWEARAELVVVGSGVAGLTAALDAAEAGMRVLVVTKDALDEGSTRWAQGGVAVVLGDSVSVRERDGIERHVEDTLVAGAGLCDADAVRSIIAAGPAAVAKLRARGALFDAAADDVLARTREGGHTAFRVVHAGGDATGAEVERALVTATRAQSLAVLTGHVAVDALVGADGVVRGLTVLDDAGRLGVVSADAVLLATGGYGHLYSSTTNPSTSTGDGLALGMRAGAVAADLEFVQFHPTVLYDGPANGRRARITEAVRGEGAVLVDATGRRFMTDVHPLAELAPRDVVAGAITRELAGTGEPCVYLDARTIDRFERRFPTVFTACAAAGVDPRREPIPVTPAAHYACGGLVTDLSGRTSVPGLYAAGEVARTGLHGANRLASNSLLEGMVMGSRVVPTVLADRTDGAIGARPVDVEVVAPVLATAARPVLQRAMSHAAAIGRSAAGLAGASDVVDAIVAPTAVTDRSGVEDAALTLVAQAVLAAAGTRRESRGCHVRSDFPDRDDVWHRESLIVRLDEIGAPRVSTMVGAS